MVGPSLPDVPLHESMLQACLLVRKHVQKVTEPCKNVRGGNELTEGWVILNLATLENSPLQMFWTMIPSIQHIWRIPGWGKLL